MFYLIRLVSAVLVEVTLVFERDTLWFVTSKLIRGAVWNDCSTLLKVDVIYCHITVIACSSDALE